RYTPEPSTIASSCLLLGKRIGFENTPSGGVSSLLAEPHFAADLLKPLQFAHTEFDLAVQRDPGRVAELPLEQEALVGAEEQWGIQQVQRTSGLVVALADCALDAGPKGAAVLDVVEGDVLFRDDVALQVKQRQVNVQFAVQAAHRLADVRVQEV